MYYAAGMYLNMVRKDLFEIDLSDPLLQFTSEKSDKTCSKG